jgi:hypothetical protein
MAGAKSGALLPQAPFLDSDLASLVERWPALQQVTRKAIIALVESDESKDPA